VGALRSALLEAITPERMRSLAGRLYDRAMGGDTAAAKLLLAYTLGRPAQGADPDRLDQDEWLLRLASPQYADVIAAAGKVVCKEALRMVQGLEPGVTHVGLTTITSLASLLAEQVPGQGAQGERPAAPPATDGPEAIGGEREASKHA
jgi:hypothetical protein